MNKTTNESLESPWIKKTKIFLSEYLIRQITISFYLLNLIKYCQQEKY